MTYRFVLNALMLFATAGNLSVLVISHVTAREEAPLVTILSLIGLAALAIGFIYGRRAEDNARRTELRIDTTRRKP